MPTLATRAELLPEPTYISITATTFDPSSIERGDLNRDAHASLSTSFELH